MKLLLDAGCDASAINDKGLSVLHVAALCGNVKAVQELRMAGFQADGKDTMGLTPEDIADTWGSHSTAWLLRKMPKATVAINTINNPSCSNIMMVSCHVNTETNQMMFLCAFRLCRKKKPYENYTNLKTCKEKKNRIRAPFHIIIRKNRNSFIYLHKRQQNTLIKICFIIAKELGRIRSGRKEDIHLDEAWSGISTRGQYSSKPRPSLPRRSRFNAVAPGGRAWSHFNG